ncbi:MAG: hypothetical protein U9O78_04960 [Patescibacteria group bacterium]|nr:hypothetical protein [Patescibacteria group bacterium]
MSINPAKYWRENKKWPKWVGKIGVVEVSTFVKIASEENSLQQPYSFAVVQFGKEKKEFVGVGHEQFESGDRVEVVLRRKVTKNETNLINYQLKIKKID